VLPALIVAPRPLLPFEIFVQLLGLFVTLNRGAGVNHDLLPVRRTVEVNIIAAGDLQHTAREYFIGGGIRIFVILIVALNLYPHFHNESVPRVVRSGPLRLPARWREARSRKSRLFVVGSPENEVFRQWRAGIAASILYLVRRCRRCFGSVRATPDEQRHPIG